MCTAHGDWRNIGKYTIYYYQNVFVCVLTEIYRIHFLNMHHTTERCVLDPWEWRQYLVIMGWRELKSYGEEVHRSICLWITFGLCLNMILLVYVESDLLSYISVGLLWQPKREVWAAKSKNGYRHATLAAICKHVHHSLSTYHKLYSTVRWENEATGRHQVLHVVFLPSVLFHSQQMKRI